MESIQDMDRLILKFIWKDKGPRIATRYGRKENWEYSQYLISRLPKEL